jgi:hypothetical protein
VPIGLGNLVNDPLSALARRLADLERLVRELAAAPTLSNASISQGGISVDAGGVIQSTDFDGTLPASPGTTGWALGGAGSSAIFNTISLRSGIISNDALANPVAPKSVHADASNFSLSTTQTAKATATVPVPAGFSTALVIAVSQVSARNTTNAADLLNVGVSVAGTPTPGYAASMSALATSSLHPVATATAAGTALLTGLGSSFTVQSLASTGATPWTADTYNAANIDAIALFFR